MGLCCYFPEEVVKGVCPFYRVRRNHVGMPSIAWSWVRLDFSAV